MLIKIRCFIYSLVFYIFRVFPIRKNKIVISSYLGRGYGNEGMYIIEAMGKERDQYDIVWLCRRDCMELPNDVRQVAYASLRSVYEQVTARVWIDNVHKGLHVKKRIGQYYMHTWHGGGPCLKWVEKDAESTLPEFYIKSAKHDSEMTDILVSGSEWRTRNIRSAFWYNGEILKCDLVKSHNDMKNINRMKKIVFDYFGIEPGAKLFLYAPTFRSDHNLACYYMDIERVLAALKNKWGGVWKIIFRLHPNLANIHQDLFISSENVIDATAYPQLDDVLMASDVLVTDCSGCMFHGFRMGKKVLLYALDLERYLKEERGLYFDIRNLPAPFAGNMDELIDNIITFNEKEYEMKRRELVEQIGYYTEGPEAAANWIKEVVLGRQPD